MNTRRRNDRGSSLVIALAFLAAFSLVLTATLSSAHGGMRISRITEGAPKELYGADGAIEQAIQQIRYDRNKGLANDTTCGTTAVLNGRSYAIDCEPTSDSGKDQIQGGGPTLGIITMSSGAGGELGYQQRGNSVVRLDGGLYSRTPVSFVNGTVCNSSTQNNCQQLNLCPKNVKSVTDAVLTNDSFTVTSASAAFRNTSTETDVGVPIYGAGIPGGTFIESVQSATQITMTKRATTSGSGRSISFRQDFPLLMVHCHSNPSSAKGTLTAIAPLLQAESCDETRVVAITLNCDPGFPTFDGNDPNYSPLNATFNTVTPVPPCGTERIVELNPGKYTDVAGLRNLTTNCDKLIHFKTATGGGAANAYYFDFTGAADPTWTIGSPNLKNLVVVGGEKTWDSRGVFLASVQNGKRELTTASATFTAADVGKFVNSSYNVPYGTRIVAVADSTHATLSNDVTSGINQGPFTIGSSASLCEATTANYEGVQFIFGGPSRINAVDNKTELCAPKATPNVVIFGAKSAHGGNLVAQNLCTTATPYVANSTAQCATLATSGPRVQFIVHGAFYAPNGVLDLSLQTVGYQVISGGVVARVVKFGISPSADFNDPLVYAPEFGSVVGADRHMKLTARIGSKAKLRAMVRIRDTRPGTALIDIGNSVTIESWTVLR